MVLRAHCGGHWCAVQISLQWRTHCPASGSAIRLSGLASVAINHLTQHYAPFQRWDGDGGSHMQWLMRWECEDHVIQLRITLKHHLTSRAHCEVGEAVLEPALQLNLFLCPTPLPSLPWPPWPFWILISAGLPGSSWCSPWSTEVWTLSPCRKHRQSQGSPRLFPS